MKVLFTLGKTLTELVLAAITFILIVFGGVLYMLKDYKEPGVGYDNNPALKNHAYEKYHTYLMKVNNDYYNSRDLYYFIAKEVKENIVSYCIDRDLKERNSTDTSGWRFAINVEEEYIEKYMISEDFVNAQFSESMRASEAMKLNRFVLQHTDEYDKQIDCNQSLDTTFETYVKNFRETLPPWERDTGEMDWISYLFFNYR